MVLFGESSKKDWDLSSEDVCVLLGTDMRFKMYDCTIEWIVRKMNLQMVLLDYDNNYVIFCRVLYGSN